MTVAAQPILVIEHETDAPVGRLADWLCAAGAELDVWRPHEDRPLPADLAGYSALVVMGGSPNANDDAGAPWLPAVRGLLAAAVATEVPTLGVCLGGQLLAVATGGRVEQADQPTYGASLVAKRQAAGVDPLFRGLPITPDVIQWHGDEVTRLPPGATLLASSPDAEVEAFRVGRLAWGLQFHIETTPDIVQGWAASGQLARDGYDVDMVLARAVAVHPDVEEVWRPFATAFVEIAADPTAAWAQVPGVQAPDAQSPQAVGGRTSLQLAGAGLGDTHGEKGGEGQGQSQGHHHAPETTAGPITDPAAIRAALAAELKASREPFQP